MGIAQFLICIIKKMCFELFSLMVLQSPKRDFIERMFLNITIGWFFNFHLYLQIFYSMTNIFIIVQYKPVKVQNYFLISPITLFYTCLYSPIYYNIYIYY